MSFLVKNAFSGKRTFFAALNFIFNRVSNSRLKQVGPDRACAEWLMRNGAYIRWKGQSEFVAHYNDLPLDESEKGTYFIEEINAQEASISHHGFAHFKGCHFITKIRFDDCMYIDNSCLKQLDLLANSLTFLEVIRCGEVTDKGLLYLKSLKQLKELHIGLLAGVKSIDDCASELNGALPNCDINIVKVLKKDEN